MRESSPYLKYSMIYIYIYIYIYTHTQRLLLYVGDRYEGVQAGTVFGTAEVRLGDGVNSAS